VQGVSFTNDGTVTGKGSFYFTGDTRNQGSFAEGAADNIIFYDTSAPQNKIFDYQNAQTGHVSRSVVSPFKMSHSCSTCYSSNAPTPLPIELAMFNATTTNAGIMLRWKTASEKNNAYFEVERSNDGFSFEMLTRIAGYGTTNTPQSYQYSDMQNLAWNSVSYYRLKQIDTDGTFTYSATISVQQRQQAQVFAYPNPFGSRITIALGASLDSEAEVVLLSLTGKRYLQKALPTDASGFLNIDGLDALPAGVYLLNVTYNNSVFIKKMLKL